ncbi:Mitochondrial fission regulator 2 [Amphibalanus amphitrite]|uniref:Mitochondrial fission regulator 2 n=1 Tax=Amphibalanus amphitrite TaxID=1232801 RepID=A0A6A4WWH6_AMPAM|nr:Mitochondrial fission regulator 2 [Amphibalanus amphitrite]
MLNEGPNEMLFRSQEFFFQKTKPAAVMADSPEEPGAAAGPVSLVRGAVHELRTDLEEVVWLLLTHTGLEASIRAVASEVHALLFRRCGRHRSVVRLVGWLLPLPAVPRPRIRLIRSDSRWSMARSCSQMSMARSASQLSLARSASQMSLTGSLASGDDEPLSARPELCDGESPRADSPTDRRASFFDGDVTESTTVDTAKLQSLEEELAKLRAQVAAIVLERECNEALSLKEQIAKNRAAAGGGAGGDAGGGEGETGDRRLSVPSMTDVLRGMGSVRLKRVREDLTRQSPIPRSPGGTPLRVAPKPADPLDPAALLAAALRRRFAHIQDSPDKEGDDHSPSQHQEKKYSHVQHHQAAPQRQFQLRQKVPPPPPRQTERNQPGAANSTTPLFGQHILRPSGRRRILGDRTATWPAPGDSGAAERDLPATTQNGASRGDKSAMSAVKEESNSPEWDSEADKRLGLDVASAKTTSKSERTTPAVKESLESGVSKV